MLVQSGAELALRLGVNDAFIGLTVIAVGTSLPELAASVSAVRAGQGDLCAGNIIGSNLFNLLLIGGGVGALTGIPLESGLLRLEYFSLLFLSFILFWFFRTGHTVSRKEGVVYFFCTLQLFLRLLADSSVFNIKNQKNDFETKTGCSHYS